MLKFQADYIFPVSQNPIHNGIIIVNHNGSIHDIIDPQNIDYKIENIKYFKGIICPGFVNTHCHLELSYLKNKIKPHLGLHHFILELQNIRKNPVDLIKEYIKEYDNKMYENGIVATIDICNTSHSFDIKTKSKIFYHNLIEIFGSDKRNASIHFEKAQLLYKTAQFFNLVSSITPHSLYAASEPLLKLITGFHENESSIFSIHHLESNEERLYFKNKSGTIPERMKHFNVDISDFKPSDKSPVETYSGIIPEKSNKLLVHNTYCNQSDINFVNNNFKNIWWCLCPNSNLFIENKIPDIKILIKNNCQLTLGTDSLASNNSLNLIDEMFTLQKLLNTNLNNLIKMSTLNGAEYMNIADNYGSFSKNKKPGIIHIDNINIEKLLLTTISKPTRIL